MLSFMVLCSSSSGETREGWSRFAKIASAMSCRFRTCWRLRRSSSKGISCLHLHSVLRRPPIGRCHDHDVDRWPGAQLKAHRQRATDLYNTAFPAAPDFPCVIKCFPVNTRVSSTWVFFLQSRRSLGPSSLNGLEYHAKKGIRPVSAVSLLATLRRLWNISKFSFVSTDF